MRMNRRVILFCLAFFLHPEKQYKRGTDVKKVVMEPMIHAVQYDYEFECAAVYRYSLNEYVL